jgi:hypothetical protein
MKNYKLEGGVKNGADWDKFIKEARVCIEL